MTATLEQVTLEQLYQRACVEADDIRLHLPTLRWLASTHRRVTEFGVRLGASTIALLSGNPHVVSYDIEETENLAGIQKAAPGWLFMRGDTLEVDIPPTDLLFIDTLHTYDQLAGELARHAGRVEHTIALHDTYCQVDDGVNDPAGMWRAIDEFLTGNPRWRVVLDEPECNGLTVLGRL